MVDIDAIASDTNFDRLFQTASGYQAGCEDKHHQIMSSIHRDLLSGALRGFAPHWG
jgi:hypothetical protein